jgi:hypothetical protein
MRKKLAFELLKIARELLGMEFDTEAEMKKYKQEHDVRPSTKLMVRKSEPAKSKSPEKTSVSDMSSSDFDWKKAEKAAAGVYSKNRLEVDSQKEILRKRLGDEADAVMTSVEGYVDDGYKNVNGYLRGIRVFRERTWSGRKSSLMARRSIWMRCRSFLRGLLFIGELRCPRLKLRRYGTPFRPVRER